MSYIRVLILLFLCSVVISGCAIVDDAIITIRSQDYDKDDKVHRGGPPPHAPAHGYRHKQQRDGVTLQFDSDLGVYAVIDMRDIYFYDGVYIRMADGEWQTSSNINGPWRLDKHHKVPSSLKKAKGKGSKKGHGKSKRNGKWD